MNKKQRKRAAEEQKNQLFQKAVPNVTITTE